MSAAAHGGPPPGPTGPSQRAQPARRPLAPFALGAAVAVVVALGVGGWFVFGRGDDEEGAETGLVAGDPGTQRKRGGGVQDEDESVGGSFEGQGARNLGRFGGHG